MQFEVIIPLIAYLVVVFGLSLYAMRKRASGSFLNEYFLGCRSMGGFVLAMTLTATYISASSFIGGPGADKGYQQTQAGQPDQQATLIARKQHVIEGDSIIATRKDGEFFPQHAQRQPDGGELDHRQQHPAQAVFIGGAGSADK